VTNQASASVPAGNVISLNPIPGIQALPGSTLKLIVSTGAPPVTVPNVVGMSQSAATMAIESAGLGFGRITTQTSTTVAAGFVISQNPPVGVQVTQGSAVALVISSGPPQVTVPNVVGLTQAAATSALQNAGFVLGSVATQASSTVAAGSVASQSPAAGSQAASGTAVNLVISIGPASVAAPQLGAGF